MRKLVLLFAMLFALLNLAYSQDHLITGKVIDETGKPIPFASVLLKGTTKGSSADANGDFSINAATNAVLVFSALGYSDVELPASSPMTVTMKSSGKVIDEVVVTALGISREKKSVNYSAQTVTAEAIGNGGRSNLIDNLNGKVSGVQITNAGGQVGSGTTIVIRGYNSLTGTNQPLYVVDGVPIDNTSDQTGSSAYNTQTANRAADLNPGDIESVTVLKGGAATALYGIQAANGAIIITTKRGRMGKINIEADLGYSMSKINKFPEQAVGYLRGGAGAGMPGGGVYNTVTTNNWGPVYASNPKFAAGTEMDLDGKGVKDVSGQPIPYYPDNYKNFFQNGSALKYGISMSGGTERNIFYAALSRLDQKGIIPNNTYDKTSALFNITNNLTQRLKVDMKFNYLNTGGKRFAANRIMENLSYYVNTWDITTFPWKDDAGQETWWQKTISSPMWTVHETGEDYRVNRYLSSLAASYRILTGLYIDYRAGIDNYTEARKNVDPIGTLSYSETNYMGGMTERRINNFQINSDLMLRLDQKLTQDLKLNALLGQNIFYRKYDVIGADGTSFVQPNLFDITNTETQTMYRDAFRKQTLGVFGSVQLNYKDFLFLDGTGRNDWSSTLPRNNNHFFYPSVTMGFVFSNFINSPILSFGKLRASYAGTANDAPVHSLVTAYNIVSPAVGGNIRFTYPTTAGNPNLRPEFTRQKEVGVDLGFIKNKIYLEATYYSKKSIDQIVYSPTPFSTGVTTQLINLGETQNKGIDATLTFKDFIPVSDFTWSSAFNFSKNVGKVIKVGDGIDKIVLVNGNWTNTEITARAGEAYGAIYGYAWKRYGVKDDDPNYLNAPILLDASGKPSRSANKVLLGNTNPDFILGWNNTLGYKGVSLGFTFEWRKGGDVIYDYNSAMTYAGKSVLTQDRFYSANTQGANATKTFTGVDDKGVAKTGTPIELSKGYYTTTFYGVDENFVEDASWLRLRNLYLNYTIPASVLQYVKLKGAEIGVAGRNLFLSTKYTGIDPEVSSSGSGARGTVGIDVNGIPATKSVDFSLRIRF